jgi:Protein of unknown function (DUF2851)
MTEKLLQYIWQFQYFNKQELFTTEGDFVNIIKQGQLNSNQGPDFINAVIKINNLTLAGNIELHLISSDWYQHQHQRDKNYSNVILHVVWLYDKPVKNIYAQNIPTIVLSDRVPKVLLNKY